MKKSKAGQTVKRIAILYYATFGLPLLTRVFQVVALFIEIESLRFLKATTCNTMIREGGVF